MLHFDVAVEPLSEFVRLMTDIAEYLATSNTFVSALQLVHNQQPKNETRV